MQKMSIHTGKAEINPTMQRFDVFFSDLWKCTQQTFQYTWWLKILCLWYCVWIVEGSAVVNSSSDVKLGVRIASTSASNRTTFTSKRCPIGRRGRRLGFYEHAPIGRLGGFEIAKSLFSSDPTKFLRKLVSTKERGSSRHLLKLLTCWGYPLHRIKILIENLSKRSFFDQNQQPLNNVEPFERILRALFIAQCPSRRTNSLLFWILEMVLAGSDCLNVISDCFDSFFRDLPAFRKWPSPENGKVE